MASLSTVRNIVGGWTVFTGTHLLLSHSPLRDKLIETLGDGPFKGMYSLVAVASFLPTTVVYIRFGAGKGVIPGWTSFSKTTPAKVIGGSLKAFGAIGFAQSIASPSPTAMAPPDENSVWEVKGWNRITRHGVFSSLALLGLGNVITRGHAGDVAYWAGYPVMFIAGCLHQDARQRSVLPSSFYEQTSLIPFVAIIEGRNSLSEAFKEFNKPALVASVVAPLFWL